jgi:hypothetical protein
MYALTELILYNGGDFRVHGTVTICNNQKERRTILSQEQSGPDGFVYVRQIK